MKNGYIAKPHKPFRRLYQRGEIYLIDKSQSTIATTSKQYGLNLFIVDHRLNVVETLKIVARKGTIFFKHVFTETDF